jgi:hypothetical protein
MPGTSPRIAPRAACCGKTELAEYATRTPGQLAAIALTRRTGIARQAAEASDARPCALVIDRLTLLIDGKEFGALGCIFRNQSWRAFLRG